MGATPRVEPVSAERLERVLPLIAAYQRFYGAEGIDGARNRAFFSGFLAPSENGMLLAAWPAGEAKGPAGGEPLGYACLYWHFSSLVPAETVLLNDLFVREEARGRGVGRALIEATAAVARERGAHHVEWATEPDNLAAQRLYDSTGAVRTEWLQYDLPL